MASSRQKTVFVTGASSGIGHSLAIEFAKRGYKVFACARRLEPMADLASDYGVITFEMDVTSAESILKGKQFIMSQLGPDQHLDILYNNAGASCTLPATDVKADQIDACFQVNVYAPMNITREFVDLVIAAKGKIAFTGSISGFAPFPFSSVYGASKAAIGQYANILALEMIPFDVKVLHFATGGVLTNIADTRPLPEDSLYYNEPMLKAFEGRQKMAAKNKPMTAEAYAKKIVDDLESYDKYNKFWSLFGAGYGQLNFYRGTFSTRMRMLCNWLPRFLTVYGFQKFFHLDKVFAAMKASKTKKSI